MEETRKRTKRRRAKGTGTLIKRGRKWYARWKYHGEETCVCTGETDREKANEFLLRKTEVLRLRGERTRIQEMSRQLEGVNERMARAVEEVRNVARVGDLEGMFRRSARRVDCSDDQMEHLYVRAIRKLVEFFDAGKEVEYIGEREAEEFAVDLFKSVGANTFNKCISALTEVWRALEASIGTGVNPWKVVKRKRPDTLVRRTLSDDEVDRMIERAEGELKVLLAVGVYTGLRLGDAAQLKWSAIKEDGMIDVRTSKTGALVSIPVHPRLKGILPDRKGTEVMPGLSRKYRADKGAVSKMVVKLFRTMDIKTTEEGREGKRARPLCTFHSLRHTFVSRAIDAGVPMHVVQQIVGHSTMMMTGHYTHITDKAIIEGLERVK